jgi:hypothetical protein
MIDSGMKILGKAGDCCTVKGNGFRHPKDMAEKDVVLGVELHLGAVTAIRHEIFHGMTSTVSTKIQFSCASRGLEKQANQFAASGAA